MADKKIEEGKLEEVAGSGGFVTPDEGPGGGGSSGLDVDKADPPSGGSPDPETEGEPQGNQDLQI